MQSEPPIESGAVLDESIELTLQELCRICAIHAERAMEMVAEGLLEPSGSEPAHWRFTGVALWRAQTALRLQRDLEINMAGAALVVELLEELQELRQRVRMLKRQLG